MASSFLRKLLRAANIDPWKADIDLCDQAINAENLRNSTRKNYSSFLKLFASYLATYQNGTSFQSVTLQQLQEYVIYLRDQECLSANTINGYLAAIRKMFHVVRNEDLTKRQLPDLKVDVALPRIPSPKEVSAMLQHCDTLQMSLLISLLVSTGMRLCEALNLRFSDVRRADGLIHIASSKGRAEGDVPLIEQIVDLLTRYVQEHNAQSPGNSLQPNDYIFFNESRTSHIPAHVLRARFKKIQEDTGIQTPYGFHAFRHFFAYHLYLESHDIILVKTALRHKTFAATWVYIRMAAAVDMQSKYKNPFSLVVLT